MTKVVRVIFNPVVPFMSVVIVVCAMETFAQCLKITEKVSFNIASEASYVYKKLKMPKMV